MSVDAEPADELPPLVLPVSQRPTPVAPAERLTAVDVLRGVALLGILPMNIVGFAWPFAAYFDPTAGGGFEGLDRAVWIVCHIVFDQKMLTIFSMRSPDTSERGRAVGIAGISLDCCRCW